MTSPTECLDCGERKERGAFTADELRALNNLSGRLEPPIEGIPVVTAILIPRRELFGVRVKRWCDTDWPTFFCPWSPRIGTQRAILHHGPAWRDADGASFQFDVDECGEFVPMHKAAHCPIKSAADQKGYFIRPIRVVALPRLLMRNGRRSHPVRDEITSGRWQ